MVVSLSAVGKNYGPTFEGKDLQRGGQGHGRWLTLRAPPPGPSPLSPLPPPPNPPPRERGTRLKPSCCSPSSPGEGGWEGAGEEGRGDEGLGRGLLLLAFPPLRGIPSRAIMLRQ